MDIDLTGSTALVSGSTAGIGFAAASELAALGARCIVNGRTAERVDAAVAKLREAHPHASLEAAPFDLSTAAGVDAIVARYPDVDILVNNLGIFEPKAFEAIPDADWLRFFETNVMSGVRLCRAYLPAMRRANYGRIVFVSSESALQIPTEMIHYGMTKTAQLAVARGIAETLAGTGVTVNSVLAGPTSSEGVETFVEAMARDRGLARDAVEKQFFQTARPSSILQRFTTPAEVANAIAYLCTPAASATTGSAMRVDGGVVRAIG